MRVAVIGAQGRMGRAVVQAVSDAVDLTLGSTLDLGDDLADVAGNDVAVVFTNPQSAIPAITACLEAGVHCVVGTTGFDDDRLNHVRQLSGDHPALGLIIVPNFAIGAVLMMEFAKRAAPYFTSVEILEEHHPDKVDAPSGTAERTAHLIAEARTGLAPAPDATAEGLKEARGALVHGIPVHSIRMRGLVAHQTVQFGNVGEMLTIRHDSTDRASFMPGVLLAARAIPAMPGMHIGLESVLEQT
jgi:4-hydroxy-tetrahydrodipicolinate reductase